MKLSKTMKKFVAYVCAITLVVAGMAGYQAEVSAETDYSTLTYTTVTCDGGEDIAYSIVSNTIVGWNTPWYGDAGNTLQFVYSADNKAADTVISINGEDTAAGVGAVAAVANALVKINPTVLEDNAYSSVVITTTTGAAEIIIKKGTPGEAGAEPNVPAETTTVDPEAWIAGTEVWTTNGVWNVWTGNGAVSQYKGNNTLDDYYINTITATGDWSVQTNTIVTGLTAGTMYNYAITIESDKAGARIGAKDDFSNSTLEYIETVEGENVIEGTFTAAQASAKLFLELGNAANTGATFHITGVEVTEYVDDGTDGIPADASWIGWFEQEGWASYGISTDATGYTLTDKNIGANWYSIQTGVDGVKFTAGKEYVCKFTLTAAQPKEFTVDNRDGDAKVFVEETAGEWTDNGDGTWSYDYEGKYTNTTENTQIINIRVALGYHNNKDGKTDANYAANDVATFTLSEFSIAAAGEEEPEVPETTTDATVEPDPEPEVPETTTETPAEPAVDYASWLTTDRNLAYGKTATGGPTWREGSATQITDGIANIFDNWGAITVEGSNTGYFDIDLGQEYSAASMDQVVVWWRTSDVQFYPNKGYKIQFATEGGLFTTVAEVTADDYPAKGDITGWNDGAQYMVPVVLDKEAIQGNVQIVRILVDNAVEWGAQVSEIAVFAENPQDPVTLEGATDPKSVSVASVNDGEITVEITADEGQEGYTYIVYLDDSTTASLTGCKAGETYTIKGVKSGVHTVKVVSYNNGSTSDGIVSDSVKVRTIIDDVADVSKNFAINAVWEMSSESAEGTGDVTNGVISSSDYVCPTWNVEGQYYIIDLGKEVDATTINSVAVWYRDPNAGCAPQDANSQDIKFSTDKATWTDVASVSSADVAAARDAEGGAPYAVVANIAAEGTVRYIQVYYPLGVTYGAQVTEIGVFGATGIEPPAAPAAPTGLAHFPAADGSLPHYFAWGAVDGAESYNIYVNGENVATSTAAGYDLAAYVSAAGTYTIEVTAVANGLESEKATISYTVEGTEPPSSDDPSGETTTPDDPVEPEMTFTTVNGQEADITEGLGNWSMWLNPTHTMEIAVDPEDADHIQAKMTNNSDNWDTWAIQYKMSKYGLTPGANYTMEIDFSADSTDFRPSLDGTNFFNGDQSQTKVTVVAPVIADADGKVSAVVGLGLVGMNVTVDISNVVVKDADGNPVDVLDAPKVDDTETTTPDEQPSDETTTPDSSAGETTTVDPNAGETTTVDPNAGETTTVGQKDETTTVDPALMNRPGKVKVKKATKKVSAKKVSIKIRKVTGATGYEVAVYKTRKNAKKNVKAIKTTYVTKVKFAVKAKKIKKAKKLFVRVRAYVDVNGNKVTGKWSKVKKVRIK